MVSVVEMSGAAALPVENNSTTLFAFFMSSISFQPPITHIGEHNWVSKLQSYLAQYDIVSEGESLGVIEQVEVKLQLQFPKEIRDYYLYFGKTSTSDFMYNLKPATEFKRLFATNWSFITLNFKMSEIDTMVVFSESPGNDPLCFDFKTGAIYLFSHDPVKKAKVFNNLSQYVIHELLETERLVGNSNISENDTKQLTTEYLSGEGIDYPFRMLKL